MTRQRNRQSAESIRSRLLQLAKREQEEFQRVLVRYANERLLYRLARSAHRDAFVLKGASLFTLWQSGLRDRPRMSTFSAQVLRTPSACASCL